MRLIIALAVGICFAAIILALTIYFYLERSWLPKESTRQFFRLSPLPLAKKLEGYFYAVRPDLYLKPATWPWFMKCLVRNESPDYYHGKVVTVEEAGKIVKLNQPLIRTDLEKLVPYPVARDIILNNPLPSLAVMECPCRAQKENSCPRDVCLVVGEPFVTLVLEHSPQKARKIGVDEALQILAAEEERGHIHTVWFKDAMHNRFYTICNCCTCCCLGMASYFRGVPRIAHSGYRPLIDREICVGCSGCTNICPFSAVEMDNKKAVVNYERCMGCGVCVSHCPVDAIKLLAAPDRGVPLDSVLPPAGGQFGP